MLALEYKNGSGGEELLWTLYIDRRLSAYKDRFVTEAAQSTFRVFNSLFIYLLSCFYMLFVSIYFFPVRLITCLTF